MTTFLRLDKRLKWVCRVCAALSRRGDLKCGFCGNRFKLREVKEEKKEFQKEIGNWT